MRAIARSTLTVAFLLASVASASAQSVDEVVDRMYETLERSAAGVDDYTLYQSMMGFATVTYMVKEVVDGRTVFVPRQVGVTDTPMGADFGGYGDLGELGPDLIEHGRYAGREEVDGTPVHVIAVDDLTQLDLDTPAPEDDMEFMPRAGRLYVHADRYVPIRMVMDGEATTGSGTHEVTMQVDMLDYREVEGGLLIPFRTTMSIEGLEAMIDPEMREQYEEMKRQLEELPEGQRAMFEQMMGGQMERIEQMMAGQGGAMSFEVVVNEVRVNTGPPSR